MPEIPWLLNAEKSVASKCRKRNGSFMPKDDNSLTGEPRELQRVELNGLHARCISLSSDGRILAAALRQPGRCLSADGKIINYSAGIAVFHVEESGKLTLMHQNDIEVGGEPLFWGGFAPALASQVVTRFHAKVNSGSQPSASVRL